MSDLFSPLTIRGVTVKNRIAVSPMSQYRAKDGHANQWHMVHLGRFAIGGAGIVFGGASHNKLVIIHVTVAQLRRSVPL